MATREQTYTVQLKALGIYEPAFDPAIRTLATMERELQRTVKAWKATAKDGQPASCDHKLYGLIQQQRKDILAVRGSLGLTPKSLRRIRGAEAGGADDDTDGITARLDALAERFGL